VTGWLLVAGDFSAHGGMDRANLELAKYLAAKDPVHLVSHRADALEKIANITVHRVSRPLGRHLLGRPLLARAGRRWAARLSAKGFRVIVNGGNCFWHDVNWVHFVHAAAPASQARGLFRRAYAPIDRFFDVRAEKLALQKARLVVCNSRRTAHDVIKRVGVIPERVKVIYLGTDPEQFPLISEEERIEARSRLGWDKRPWVTYIGSLGDTRKGFDTLYAAWRQLCHDPHWDANLAVVGAGSALADWRVRASADNLTDHIRFLGFRKDVPTILAAADVLVHPARYEPYGLAPHEALCRGLPAIVSAASGVSERLPPDLADLILEDPDSPQELEARIRHWRANQTSFAARIRSLADELRARTWEVMAREMRDTILGS
jgi:glycosyltransferase involved in cell wall biosynthesis